MSRRANLINLLVAAATGVISGVYIFKPMMENASSKGTQLNALNQAQPNDDKQPTNSASKEALKAEGDAKAPISSADTTVQTS